MKLKTTTKMKKAFSIIAVAFIATSFASCGASAEDKAKLEEREKQIKDSIANTISQSMETVEAAVDTAAAAAVSTATDAAAAAVEATKK